MKLLLVNSLYHPQELGGAERAVRLLGEGLAGRGFEVTVACLSPSGREERGAVGGVRVVRLPLANLYWPFSPRGAPVHGWKRALWHAVDSYNPVMGRRLGRVLDEARPDLVHFHNMVGFSAAGLAAARRRRIPAMQTTHDYYFVCPRASMFRGGANCERPCASCRVLTGARRRASQRVDLVCGVSEAMLRRLENGGAFQGAPRRAVAQTANLPPVPVAPRRDRRPGERLRAGFLGRLEPIKGIETLFAALRLLRDVPVEVALAGRGQPAYEAELRASAADLPVRFLGHVDPNAFLAELDVLVVPSLWHEPFARVLQEAFSFGVPVVGSEAGGTPEAIGSADLGFLFPPGDAARLAAILRRMVVEGFPAARFAEACLARSADFSADAVLDRHVELYRQVLDGSGSAKGAAAGRAGGLAPAE